MKNIRSVLCYHVIDSESIDMVKTTAKQKRVTNKVRLAKAKIAYENIMQEIQPFIKKRPISYPSTAGQWKTLSLENSIESD